MNLRLSLPAAVLMLLNIPMRRPPPYLSTMFTRWNSLEITWASVV